MQKLKLREKNQMEIPKEGFKCSITKYILKILYKNYYIRRLRNFNAKNIRKRFFMWCHIQESEIWMHLEWVENAHKFQFLEYDITWQVSLELHKDSISLVDIIDIIGENIEITIKRYILGLMGFFGVLQMYFSRLVSCSYHQNIFYAIKFEFWPCWQQKLPARWVTVNIEFIVEYDNCDFGNGSSTKICEQIECIFLCRKFEIVQSKRTQQNISCGWTKRVFNDKCSANEFDWILLPWSCMGSFKSVEIPQPKWDLHTALWVWPALERP